MPLKETTFLWINVFFTPEDLLQFMVQKHKGNFDGNLSIIIFFFVGEFGRNWNN